MIAYFQDLFANVFTPTVFGNLWDGTQVTAAVTLLAGLFGLILGLLAALGRMSGILPLRIVSVAYVEFFRGTPLLVQLFILWFGLPTLPFFQWDSAFQAGTTGMSLYAGAYFSEIIRGAFQAVPKGQLEAAQVLGLNRFHSFRFVQLPQAIRLAVPALGNQFISLIKDSTLVTVISVQDLLFEADNVVSRTFRPFPIYIGIAMVYLVLSNMASLGVNRLEAYYERPYRPAK
ncbi:MAG: amino acid ABC transporter permease [Trueperaceae bacterium]|nr:amino acid ABC transporter permease [Trueperaceae bacterium]